MKSVCTGLFVLALAVPAAQAQMAQGPQTISLANGLQRGYDNIKRNLTEMSQGMAEGDYTFMPTKDVRTFGGFVVTFAPGTDYDSENYRWFTERYGDGFLYLDRVVVDPAVRRRGVAGRVYDLVESVASAYGLLALEVNLVPRNDASLAFHLARGFVEVGRLGDDSHLVSLQTKQVR